MAAAPAAGRPAATLLGGARVVATTRAEGDARPAEWSGAPARPLAPVARPGESWTFVHQVHGARVAVTRAPTGPLELEADAIVSAAPGAVLAVLGADCALVGFASAEGVVGVAHAGWRGLLAGVLGETVAAMRELGATAVEAVLSACIHPECYAFSPGDLDAVARVLGPEVVATTAAGGPALDLPAGVAGRLEALAVPLVGRLGGCTACSPGWYSHRARADSGRHALAIAVGRP